MEEDGINEPIQFSEWVALIVPVVKRSGSIRVCGDYKVTVNQAAKLDTYPLLRSEDINFCKALKRKTFHKTRPCPCISATSTSQILKRVHNYQHTQRLVSPSLWNSLCTCHLPKDHGRILRGIPHVSVYIDDILITGKNEEEHLKNS